ncbi:ROK family protein [Paenibacillus sp. LHD-117]|uniref:ROK family protein n=1 Tax=Paenibacillus sp. LHD-117 TaxID=3071412 RepID=UPI0027E07D57|nr:ROK family protein [Paenibacillus sp. LHD-117]MDQ6423491.1 ROK family protein [Paenibacillus sp. LHD-117]
MPSNQWVSVDVGGTEIKYAVFTDNGNLIYNDKRKTPSGAANIRIPEAVAAIIQDMLERYGPMEGVGISTAGVVDTESGEIIFAGGTIPEYKGTNLKRTVEERFGLRTTVANDVNAAAVGEWWRGAAAGADDFFCMTLGTGIGGALFCGGRLVTGAHYRAGEIGHSLYDKDSGTTYEQRASTSALLKRAARELPDFDGSGFTLFEQAKAGNAPYLAVIDRWTEEIARGIAGIIVVSDPALIVIGGGVSEQGDYLLDKIKLQVSGFLPPGFSQTELTVAKLGNKAALYGAIYPYFKKETER